MSTIKNRNHLLLLRTTTITAIVALAMLQPISHCVRSRPGSTTSSSDGTNHHELLSLCYHGDSDCPDECPPGRNVSMVSMLHLSFLDEMKQHVLAAQQMIRAAAPSPESIIRFENVSTLHTSLNYWCCHTPAVQDAIVDIVKNLDWHAISLTINETSCNVDRDNHTVYMLSVYDSESQKRLFDLIRRIENSMRAAGIPVINPRHQAFHSTMARVVADEYPVDEVLRQIQLAVPVFATFDMTVMEVGGEMIYARPSW